MVRRRTNRLNSLLKEVISDIIHKELSDPRVSKLTTVTQVSITRDLRYAKVYVSIIGSEGEKKETLKALKSASGFIAIQSSKEITIRYFPKLSFILDEGVDKQMHIEKILADIESQKSEKNDHAS